MASAKEKFCLRWNDFEKNISGAFQEIRSDKDFFDVTLSCEDGQVSAHKLLLSSCSPFFRAVLRRNPHQHPLLYFKGIRHTELSALMDFMYQGEVSVAQEDLNTFLSVAEELKVKGLTQNETENKQASRRGGLSKKSSQESQHKAASSDSQYRKYQQQPHEDAEADIQEIVPVKMEAQGEMFEDQEYSETEYNEGYEYEEAAPEMDTSLMSAEVGNRDLNVLLNENMTRVQGGWQCRLCQKIDTKSHIEEHLESAHLEGVEYPCQFCGIKKHSRTSLRKHVASAHR